MSTLLRYFSRKRKHSDGNLSTDSDINSGLGDQIEQMDTNSDTNSTEQSENVPEAEATTRPTPTAQVGATQPCQNENAVKKRKHEYKESWKSSRPWLEIDDKKCMYCSWCVKSNKVNAFTKGCTNYRSSTLARHVALPSHKEAVQDLKMRSNMETSTKNAFQQKAESITRALQSTYWLAKENIASLKYESLLDFLDFQGVDVNTMSVGGNASYKSRGSVREFQESIFETIEADVLEKVDKSPFISVLCDESTDISNTKKLILYVRLLDPDTFIASTHFIGNITVEGSSCTAEVLFNLIIQFLEEKKIDISKVIGFGSDGAAVMTGSKNGVATRFRSKCPHIVSIHCMAHRLNLCTSQASRNIPYMKQFEETFTQLYRFFEKSANREAELKEIQKVLDSPELKVREVHEIRWLAFYDALTAVFHSYRALVKYFKKHDKSKNVQEILEKLTDYRFVSVMHIMMDIIPHLSQLCLLLQKSDLDIAAVKPAIQNTLACIKKVESGDTVYQRELREKLKTTSVGEKVKLTYKEIEVKIHRSTVKKAKDDIDKIRKDFASELKHQITRRFPTESQNIADAFDVLGLRNMAFLSTTELETYGVDKIEQLCNHFGKEKAVKELISAPIINTSQVLAEWNLAKSIIKQEKYPRNRMMELWQLVYQHHKETFPNLLKLAAIAMVMPYQTDDCERGFSEQNQTKTKLRNRLEQRSLCILMMIKLEGPPMRDFNFKKALLNWQQKKERRVFASKFK